MKLNSKALRELVATVAPTVATALGGPLAGLATRALAGKLLGVEDADPEQLEAALSGLSGADMVKLKEVEAEFKTDMKNAGIELERIASGDRDSARVRQVKMKDWTPSVLGVVIITGFFGLLAYLVKYGLPTEGSDVLLIMIGALAAMTTQVGNFFFGSSTGSKAKDDIIADLKRSVK